ncbi:MAG: hypothetical protein UT65_C0019G0010 [Parcubacteria group bacterium GW2011_GWF2_39_8b]|uniref:Nudix hydrolase domain-containing protein n=3 Tax=Candidatus Zambryskiibacteriota TaxID=1817925 RepID=A0A1G2T5P0_9BACT|nr:MAG: hypothetical protein UT65_C0019G0010 [Parcubacteria group bacterium GW2011_GWF2_39_8b]KKR45814.1 MAG: hypothetical protein UT81_C0006G0039 [Parcubacteria group bacterium GW2011_GWA2_40_14]OHA92595.1 MAG: hypothetical protein A2W58_01800 [Candidatus Zambryskibacteria bacterium RIFCSPHIGHO2_02_38_10.5]OHA97730.1 MAG: hypothetical protein A3E32_00945 [Candidatus Zambryskibacteria bacterium RIFCSPHIGHO2_12_FULL_38_37]OHB08674.1 MAG: hypothetical protein A2W64_02080 [Candidatus Zambryskibact
MKKERGNGANVIVLSPTDEMLVVRQNYGEKKWMLPGGNIERGESPRHAAQEETEEEAGTLIDEKELKLIACFVQRPNGIVFLYETRIFSGEILQEPTNEIIEVRFMSFEEIMERRETFGLGYMRMIVRYMRCKQGIDSIPYEGRLSDPVEYPKNLLAKYNDLVLSI